MLPFCSEETLEQLEANLAALPSTTAMLNSGMTPQDITEAILKGMGVAPGQKSIEPRWVLLLCMRLVWEVAGMAAEPPGQVSGWARGTPPPPPPTIGMAPASVRTCGSAWCVSCGVA